MLYTQQILTGMELCAAQSDTYVWDRQRAEKCDFQYKDSEQYKICLLSFRNAWPTEPVLTLRQSH